MLFLMKRDKDIQARELANLPRRTRLFPPVLRTGPNVGFGIARRARWRGAGLPCRNQAQAGASEILE